LLSSFSEFFFEERKLENLKVKEIRNNASNLSVGQLYFIIET
jgi:hypothetical protein